MTRRRRRTVTGMYGPDMKRKADLKKLASYGLAIRGCDSAIAPGRLSVAIVCS
jgi:hypothetical protein